MTDAEQLMQGLSDAGCSEKASELICTLFEKGSYKEMLHQMKMQRCELIDEMHKSQRRVDRMDYLIHAQENRMK